MANLTIRNYTAGDLGACRSLWGELTQHHRDIYDDQSIGGDNPGLYFDEHLKSVGAKRIWLAEYDGQVVGMTGLILDGKEAEVEPVIVASSQRGRGIGRLLLEHAKAEARKMGVNMLSIRPVARNAGAISLFHDFGFQTLGHIDMFMELSPDSERVWKPGLTLHGHEFRH